MAGRIPQSFIDELLARVDIVEVIHPRVPLKKAGRNFVARCPFHDEKTPSFTVSPHKQFYYCFGCGASGSAIGFLMAHDHLTFPEAVETLAAQYGLTVPREGGGSGPAPDRYKALLDLNHEVAVFYARQLRESCGQAAVQYLRRRGVDGVTAKRYALGYAPAGWETLCRRFDPVRLQEAGLAVAREGGGCYDRFRHRLMFPIRNRRGQVIGFGGRSLEDGAGPKYLNSPETPVFQKGKEVYGLYEMLQACGRPARILVVEGYMDVIALAQQGIPEVVATLGTAVTEEHLRLLFRHTSVLTFCFDGDRAGRKAAWRALEAALPLVQEGRKVYFLWLPEGEDPDSLVRKEGRESFLQRLRRAEPLSDYFFQALGEGLDLTRLEDRADLSRRAAPLLRKLPAGPFRRMMQARLAELAGDVGVENKDSRPRTGRSPALNRPSLVQRVVFLLFHHPELWRNVPDSFRETALAGEYGELLAIVANAMESDLSLEEALRNGPHGNSLQLDEIPPVDPERELTAAVRTLLQVHRRQKRLAWLNRKADTEGLTPEEKAELRRLLTAKGGRETDS